MELQVNAIDKVIKNAIEVMESSKYQVFEICEAARQEFENLEKELVDILEQTTQTILRVDQLEVDYRKARVRLSEVSRDFQRFKEQDIKIAYELATKLQLDLTMMREKETQLKTRRDELKLRIRNIERSIERAEVIGSQMNVVLEYLSGDLNQVTRIIESAKNRQILGLKIILAQEEERKRIAREIHDGPAQSMANIVLRTEIAERMIGKQEFEMVRVELGDLKSQVRDGLEEIRKIIFNLRPMALDDLGLIPTLRKYVQDYEEKTLIRTRFDMIGKEARLPSAMEVAIYRLVQEAFTNGFKHASASFISLEVTFQLHMVKIVIQDNGVGFNTDKFEVSAAGSHYGLIGMRERVELLEGRMELQSAQNAGTKITMLIPVSGDNRKE
ncbi:histidine kinase [Paenibacillus swuensis]|uniref:Signal transduction histidine-protein kinase/phosphatase DegS n=1 Tax=Paenibacillus swuensis TaxID=1178515 RepID=A0A172TIT6_9BACL|nr:sensor histidine kinase [Paenibacillus swuensis]ANE46703.1 histidine kinase [Paenibacillus swuensis]